MTSTEGTDMNITIDPLHPAILKSYKASLHGDDRNGVFDIEFATMHHATSWAQTCAVEDRVWLRGYDQHRFNNSVVISLYPTTASMPDAIVAYGMHGVGPIMGPEDEPSLADFR